MQGRRRSIFAGVGGMVASSGPEKKKEPTCIDSSAGTDEREELHRTSVPEFEHVAYVGATGALTPTPATKHVDHQHVATTQQQQQHQQKQKQQADGVDWSSFPLFPLEQINMLNIDDLVHTEEALVELMASMSSASQGESEVALLEYARREQREITRRLEALEASERVSRMLCSGHVPAIAELNIVPGGTSENLQAKLKLNLERKPDIHEKDERSSSRTTKSYTSHTSILAPSKERDCNAQVEDTRHSESSALEFDSRELKSGIISPEGPSAADNRRSQEIVAREPKDHELKVSNQAEDGKEANAYLAAKKMTQAARRATIAEAKTFVVFSESSRREKRLRQEEQRARMLARARAKTKKKRREEKRKHLEKLQEARERLKEREASRVRWERERQERVARAEALAQEMRRRKKVDSGLSHENQSNVQSTSDVIFNPQTPRRRREEEEEEDDEDVVALEEAIEEEKAANEDVQGSSRVLENVRANLVTERDINAESDGDDSASVVSGQFDDSGGTGEKGNESDISVDKEDDALGTSITPPQATAESKEPLDERGVNGDFSGLRISLDQDKTEIDAPEQQQRASAKFERAPDSPASLSNGVHIYPFSPGRLDQISPVSAIASSPVKNLSTEAVGAADVKAKAQVSPALQTAQELLLSQAPEKLDVTDTSSPRPSRHRIRSRRREDTQESLSENLPSARSTRSQGQQSARSTLSQKEALLDQLKQDMANVRHDMEVDLSAFAVSIDDDGNDEEEENDCVTLCVGTAMERERTKQRSRQARGKVLSTPNALRVTKRVSTENISKNPCDPRPVRTASSDGALKVHEDASGTASQNPTPLRATPSSRVEEAGNQENEEEPANNSEVKLVDDDDTAAAADDDDDDGASLIREQTECQRVLEGLGGLVVDYSDHFTCFGDIFSVSASQDLRKANRAQVLNDVLAHTIETFSQTNKALALELCPEDSTQWLEMSANRFFRVLSKSRHEVFNIVRDAGLKLDTLGVEDSGSLVESKLRESTGEMSKKVALTARTPMTLLPQWAGAVWNLLWTWSKPKINRETLLRWQRVNHFRTARTLTRKDLLKKELQRYRSMSKFLSHEFELLPDTFILPKEYLQFVDAFAKYGEQEPDGNFWIMKPVGLSRGRGISLVSDIGDVCYGQSVIIQRYVSNPMLLDGYKFDLRIYVLVTSFQPLEAWIYDEGFVRVCTHKYSSASIDIHNLFIHLTNSSIQKMGPNGAGTKATAASISRHQAEIDEAGGTKLSLSYLWRRLGAQGLDVEKIQSAIKQLILKSLVCCDQSMDNDPNSFELFGYDVLLDENVRPWLIEVNSSPSLAQENQLDSKIKRKLIADTLRLVNPMSFDRAVLLEVLQRRQAEMAHSRLRPFKQTTSSRESERQRLNRELTAIFRGRRPRSLGEEPEERGGYHLLCPNTPEHESIKRILRQERGVKIAAAKRQGASGQNAKSTAVGLGSRGLEYLAEGCNVKL